jgi:hypothetical protein
MVRTRGIDLRDSCPVAASLATIAPRLGVHIEHEEARPKTDTPSRNKNAKPGGPRIAAAGIPSAHALAAMMQTALGETFMRRPVPGRQ